MTRVQRALEIRVRLVGSKGGWLAHARHDAGLIWREDGSRLAAHVVLTAEHPDTRVRIDHPATVATARFVRDVAQLALTQALACTRPAL